MNQEVNIDNKKKKLKIYYSLLITVICIIGVSFAWFRLYLSQSEDNTLASRTCFSTSLTEDTSKIELTDAFPISNEDGLKGTPFTFTIKNNCSNYVKAYITIKSTYRTSTDSAYLKDNYIKVNISPKDTTKNPSVVLGSQTLTDLDNNSKGYIIVDTGLNSNEEKSYDLRIWMDSAVTTEQGLDKIWAGKIVVMTEASELPSAPNGWYEAKDGTLLAALKRDNEITSPLTIPGKEVSAHTLNDISESKNMYYAGDQEKYYITYGTDWKANENGFDLTGTSVTKDIYVNSYSELIGKYLTSVFFSITGSETAGEMAETTGLSQIYYIEDATTDGITYKVLSSNKDFAEAVLSSAEDDYGTSYYYRGAVKDNYLEFANKCWRIVRIAGDGTIKLVLHNDNINNKANPCSKVNNDESAAFAHYDGTTYTSTYNSNENDNAYVGFMYGTAGSSSYTSTHANTNKSTILTNLETWYTNNLASYADKIADTVWCSDKSVVTETSFNPWDSSTPATGLGYKTNKTYYGTAKRLVSPEEGGEAGGTGPSLKCSNELSKITSKIGLLSADEIVFAGYIPWIANSSLYLQENATENFWWTLSPNFFNDNSALVWGVNKYVGLTNEIVNNAASVRPSISLKSDVNVTGSGTSEAPYKIS